MFKDRNGLIVKNQYGNTEFDSFSQTVELFVRTREDKLRETLQNSVEKMDLGDGTYKNHPEFPHPKLDRSERRFIDKRIFKDILTYYNITNQHNKIKEIQKGTKMFLMHREKSIGFMNMMFLIFLMFKRIFK